MNLSIPDLTGFDLDRFYDKIKIDPKTKCWNWTASTRDGGYGKFRISGVYYMATRVAYKIFNNSDPEEYLVCHSCDNPSCVKREHLFLGDFSSNALDRESKGRRGGHIAKLWPSDIKKIFQLDLEHKTSSEIAKVMNVDRRYISAILSGQERCYDACGLRTPEESR